jgi:hypothetical protein
MEINVGDFLLTEQKQLFRIIDVYVDDTGIYYDIKSYDANVDYYGRWDHQYIRAIHKDRLKQLGKIIPEEKITKMTKILYG